MTRDELLYKLRGLETRLLDPDVDAWVDQQSPDDRKKFVALSLDLHLAITKLTTAQLSDIADRLDHLSADLKTGIASLQGHLDNLAKTVKVIDTLSTVVGYAARIVGLAM